MGSQSDWPTMREAAPILDELGIAYEARSSAPIARRTGCGTMARRRWSAG
jgi:phosphoribosylcarboxyaminoimidazole (NCAIR) mutase